MLNKIIKWVGLILFATSTFELVMYMLGKYNPSSFGIGVNMFGVSVFFLTMFLNGNSNNYKWY